MCVCCIRQFRLILKEIIFLHFLLFQVTLSKAEVTENMRATSLQMPLGMLELNKTATECFNFFKVVVVVGRGSSSTSNEEIHARKKNVRGGTHLL